jgi:signal transduction histidine kinase
MEAMGGSIEVTSGPGSGSRFTLVLPRVVPSPSLPADAAVPARPLIR